MSSTNNLPRSECPECGRRCRTISGICGPCQGIGVDSHALTGGHWVTVRGIRRWQPDTETVRPIRPVGRPALPAECGTERGYQKHRHAARKGAASAVWPLPADDPCGCRAAHREHEAVRVRALTREHRPATKEVA